MKTNISRAKYINHHQIIQMGKLQRYRCQSHIPLDRTPLEVQPQTIIHSKPCGLSTTLAKPLQKYIKEIRKLN